MWTHISKNVIEEKYGGQKANMSAEYWPPKKELMTTTSRENQNNLISVEQYKKLYNDKKLLNRKIYLAHVYVIPERPTNYSEDLIRETLMTFL